ncbi:MAG: hypothetical protein IJD45_04855 [Clostridia bacterium]|nr:hypothetical protein [Clostridia bacterium]
MNNLKVGFSQVNINPSLGDPVAGYFVPRFGKGFLDDLTISTILLTCEETKIALISIDIVGFTKEFYKNVCEEIEKATNIPKENIFMSATHTHTGAFVTPDSTFSGDQKILEEYAEFVTSRLIESVAIAKQDIKPAKMGFITGYAPERVAYIRLYKMKDGTTMTCPPIDDPNIDHPLGELDQRVNVVRFDREDAPNIVLVNYGLHADTTNGELFSADWPHWLRVTLDKALDGVKCVFFNGAEGDVGSTNVHPTGGDMNDTDISFDNEMKSPGMARFVGRAIAGSVLQVYDKAEYIDVENIDILHKTIRVPSNMPKKHEIPLAKKYKELHESGRDDEIPFEAMELTTVVAEAIRICDLQNGPEFFEIELTGVKIGDIAMLGIPGEPFTDIGVQIKKAPGYKMIMPCSLTCGDMGYFPTKPAFDAGGYEARSSLYKPCIAEKIVKGSVELLESMK